MGLLGKPTILGNPHIYITQFTRLPKPRSLHAFRL